MNTVQAVSDRLFVRLEESSTDSKLILTKPVSRTVGTVISVGPLVKAAKVGDKVLFHVFDELPTFDPNVVVIRENSLLGQFVKNDNNL